MSPCGDGPGYQTIIKIVGMHTLSYFSLYFICSLFYHSLLLVELLKWERSQEKDALVQIDLFASVAAVK